MWTFHGEFAIYFNETNLSGLARSEIRQLFHVDNSAALFCHFAFNQRNKILRFENFTQIFKLCEIIFPVTSCLFFPNK